jgi:hypothetical protein
MVLYIVHYNFFFGGGGGGYMLLPLDYSFFSMIQDRIKKNPAPPPFPK